MFAVCLKYPSLAGLTTLPADNYLCANCTADNKDCVLQDLRTKAQTEFNANPKFILQFVVIAGILQ
jgi:hypothetical protein